MCACSDNDADGRRTAEDGFGPRQGCGAVSGNYHGCRLAAGEAAPNSRYKVSSFSFFVGTEASRP